MEQDFLDVTALCGQSGEAHRMDNCRCLINLQEELARLRFGQKVNNIPILQGL